MSSVVMLDNRTFYISLCNTVTISLAHLCLTFFIICSLRRVVYSLSPAVLRRGRVVSATRW